MRLSVNSLILFQDNFPHVDLKSVAGQFDFKLEQEGNVQATVNKPTLLDIVICSKVISERIGDNYKRK